MDTFKGLISSYSVHSLKAEGFLFTGIPVFSLSGSPLIWLHVVMFLGTWYSSQLWPQGSDHEHTLVAPKGWSRMG